MVDEIKKKMDAFHVLALSQLASLNVAADEIRSSRTATTATNTTFVEVLQEHVHMMRWMPHIIRTLQSHHIVLSNEDLEVYQRRRADAKEMEKRLLQRPKLKFDEIITEAEHLRQIQQDREQRNRSGVEILRNSITDFLKVVDLIIKRLNNPGN